MKNFSHVLVIVFVLSCFVVVQAFNLQINEKSKDIEESETQRELTPTEKQVKEILKQAEKSSNGLSYDLVKKLVDIGEPAKKTLIEALYSKNEKVVETAVKALTYICDSTIIPDLVVALIKQKSNRSSYYIHIEIRGFKEKAIPELVKYIDNDDEYIRYRIVMLLGEIGGNEELLKKQYKKENSDIVKLQIICYLHATDKKNRKEYLEFVDKMLTNKDSFTRALAVGLVGEIKDTTKIDFLIKCIDDHSYDVRCSAISSLSIFCTKEAISAIIKALKHKDLKTRYYAAKALQLCRLANDSLRRNVIEGLVEALNDKNKEVRKSVIKALSRFDDMDIIPHLEKIVNNDPEEELRKYAKEVIEVIEKKNDNSKDTKNNENNE